jgi:peptidoglycan/LPS O-acetylase OafA/YrhL
MHAGQQTIEKLMTLHILQALKQKRWHGPFIAQGSQKWPIGPRVRERRADIQGLRALAVLAVVTFHVDSSLLPGGFIGVDVFFVVSGFLITSIIRDQLLDSCFNIVEFFLGRLRRILPAYMAMLGLTSIVMAILLTPNDFRIFFDSLESASYFNSNSFFASHYDYFSPAAHELPLLHTWSLAIEMQFYLILPIVMLLIPHRAHPILLVIGGIGLLLVAQNTLGSGQRQSVYFSLAARIPEFLVGSLLAYIPFSRCSPHIKQLLSVSGLGLVLGSFTFIGTDDTFPGFLAMPACIGTAMMIFSRGSALNAHLGSSPLTLIGNLSYSIYLWHWPILTAIRYTVERYELTFLEILAALLATAVISVVSYRYVERPFRKKLQARKEILLFATVLIGVLASALGARHFNPRLVETLPTALTRYADPATICHGKVVDNCLRGAREGEHTVLLIGDSHAAQLNLFADVVGEKLGLRFKVMTASSCVPIPGFDTDRIKEAARLPCTEQIAAIQQQIANADAVIIAGMWSYHMQSAEFSLALTAFLSDMRAADKPTLLLAQVPMFLGNTQRSHRFAALGLHRHAQLDDAWIRGNRDISELAREVGSMTYMDLSSLPVFQDAPFLRGELIYFDEHHLNERGSLMYGQDAAPMIADWP